jgi:protein-L-isoaspartate(D-aspartate) O-methyltransferase
MAVAIGIALLSIGALVHAASTRAADSSQHARVAMIEEQIVSRGVTNADVLRAMRAVPRHRFVPEEYQARAYGDHPLPIGHGQTISQPYIVALMTEMLRLKSDDRVLEIGTGSGDQAAILKEITPHVYTIEIVRGLYEKVLPILKEVSGLDTDRVRHGDGYDGWPEAAPFDAIIVTAAADHIPPPLIAQLKPGGRMAIPVGPVHGAQRLVLVEKDTGSRVRTRTVLPVRFVPLTRF